MCLVCCRMQLVRSFLVIYTDTRTPFICSNAFILQGRGARACALSLFALGDLDMLCGNPMIRVWMCSVAMSCFMCSRHQLAL